MKVMFIDDDQIERMKFKKAVVKVQFSVTIRAYASAIDALLDIEEGIFGPDLIVVDYNMPQMNGISFVKKLRTLKSMRCVPVIMFSTSENLFDVENSFHAGASAYLVKPLTYGAYIESIESMFLFWSKNLIRAIQTTKQHV
jgi:PleD family two-component response regulator